MSECSIGPSEMADLSKRKAISIVNALKKFSKEPAGSTNGMQMSIVFIDAKNVKNSTSAVSPITTTIEDQEILPQQNWGDLPPTAVALLDAAY